jgi:hypothetical protein
LFVEARTVLCRVAIVLGQNVALDLHHARLGHARRVGAGGAVPVMQAARFGTVFMFMRALGVVRLCFGVPVCMDVHAAIGMAVRVFVVGDKRAITHPGSRRL